MSIVGSLVAVGGLAMWLYAWVLHKQGLRDQDRWMQERADREGRLREMAERLKKGEAEALERIRSTKEAAEQQTAEHSRRLRQQGLEEHERWLQSRVERERELDKQADLLKKHAAEVDQRVRATQAAAEQELARLRAAAEAIRNQIEGYGNRHLIPVASLIDDLAEATDYEEAGKKLKWARSTTRRLIRDGWAVVCDSLDDPTSQQLIDLVLSAFQTTAENVIADVQNANFGQSAQRIRDAFNLVNYYGQACRNTRITDALLNTRLDELKWAAICRDLLRQEREQQKRLREEAREEERARREAAEAVERAAKEQALIELAIRKAKEQADHASAEQRERYEEEMLELQQRLKEAEERNQRAKSMAEQTRRGHVYVISNVGSFGDGVYKIGLTRRLDPMDRIWELSDASVPFDFDVHAIIPADDAPALEHELHNRLVLSRVNKVNHRKEFFRANLSEVRETLTGMGVHVQWTMAAAAAEHRETQAIEQVLSADPQARERWIKRQNVLESMEESDSLASRSVSTDTVEQET
jgi:hypothetical protein